MWWIIGGVVAILALMMRIGYVQEQREKLARDRYIANHFPGWGE